MSDDVQRRLARVEYILMRLATRSPDSLPDDARPLIVDIVREVESADLRQHAGMRIPCHLCGGPCLIDDADRWPH